MPGWQIKAGERPTERELEWLVNGIFVGMVFAGQRAAALDVARDFEAGRYDRIAALSGNASRGLNGKNTE